MGQGRQIVRRIARVSTLSDAPVTAETLRTIYGMPGEAALRKEIDHVNDHYRALIEASPFVVLATSGPAGLECSPRGDAPGFVRVRDPKTLLLPDRRGNNRIDSLLNLVNDAHVALLFLIPGCAETLRVTGRATISLDPDLAREFAVQGRSPRCVLVIGVERVYFQCGRAILRANLWDPACHVQRAALPSVGSILAELSGKSLGGEEYDRALPERLRRELY
jgi:uncharacterized protein